MLRRATEERVLLAGLGGGDDPLAGCLRSVGFAINVAADYTELCLKLLTWRPHAVLADAALGKPGTRRLARAIRGASSSALGLVLAYESVPHMEPDAVIVLKPFVLEQVTRALRVAIATRSGRTVAGTAVAPPQR